MDGEEVQKTVDALHASIACDNLPRTASPTDTWYLRICVLPVFCATLLTDCVLRVRLRDSRFDVFAFFARFDRVVSVLFI